MSMTKSKLSLDQPCKVLSYCCHCRLNWSTATKTKLYISLFQVKISAISNSVTAWFTWDPNKLLCCCIASDSPIFVHWIAQQTPCLVTPLPHNACLWIVALLLILRTKILVLLTMPFPGSWGLRKLHYSMVTEPMIDAIDDLTFHYTMETTMASC